MTVIHSNGSRWNGEPLATIDELIEVLKIETIEERFFRQFTAHEGYARVIKNHCPIKMKNGVAHFFGNFEQVSHVFRIDTDDAELIERLSNAIKKNAGWEKYYVKNLAPTNTERALISKVQEA